MNRLLAAAALLVAASAPALADEPVTVVALGDSLTAGYGLPPGEGFVQQLQRALDAAGLDVVVVDAGVSGDTTSGGLARLDWSVGPEADAVIVELGANDALRGLPPAKMGENLTAILDRLEGRGLPVLLSGMIAPENFGPDYAAEYRAAFEGLAKRDVLYDPFFLEGVAGKPSLILPDGLHPTAEGVGVIVERLLPQVKELVARARAGAA